MLARQAWKHALIGCRWLVEKQNADGSWIGLPDPKVDAFYKVSWALMLTGQATAAHKTLNYVQDNFLTPDGDFLPRSHHSRNREVHYLYPNAYLIIGSMAVGRYEIALPGVRFLISNQDPDHGGFYSRRPNPGQKTLSDTMSAGAAGLACLAAGQINAALHVAKYLANIIKLQPTPAECFFTTVKADGQLLTDVKDDSEAFLRIIDTRKEGQCWYAVGLPFAFLVLLAEATGKTFHFEQAQWYFDFQKHCVNPWNGNSSAKAGWGCAMLYRLTGETQYREIALRIAENIMKKQNLDGSWLSVAKGYRKVNQLTLSDADFDLTAEYTLWLSLISTNILVRDSNKILDSCARRGYYRRAIARRWLQHLMPSFLK